MNSGRINVFYLKRKVIFPQCTLNFTLHRTELAESINTGDRLIAYPLKFYIEMFLFKRRTAVISEVVSIDEKEERVRLNLKGIARVKLKKFHAPGLADFSYIQERVSTVDGHLVNQLRKTAQELIFLINVSESDRLISLLNYLSDPGQMSDFIANYFIIDFRKRYYLLREEDQGKRVQILIGMLKKIIEKMKKRTVIIP